MPDEALDKIVSDAADKIADTLIALHEQGGGEVDLKPPIRAAIDQAKPIIAAAAIRRAYLLTVASADIQDAETELRRLIAEAEKGTHGQGSPTS